MPADQGPPSAEVLAALVVSLRSELAQARAELERARERIAELEARLRQTPRNSSEPPSSEGLAKPAPRLLRKKSGRRPGGQDGHKGQTPTQVARPDREVWHEPGGCGRCGAALAGRPVSGVDRRQVFDLPPVRAEVTEHQLIERECACGHRRRRPFPGRSTATGGDRQTGWILTGRGTGSQRYHWGWRAGLTCPAWFLVRSSRVNGHRVADVIVRPVASGRRPVSMPSWTSGRGACGCSQVGESTGRPAARAASKRRLS